MSAIDEIRELVEDGFDAVPSLYAQAHEEYEAMRQERDDARLMLRACAALKTDVRRGIFHKTNWQWSVPLYRTDKAPKTGPHDFRLVASANGSEDSDVPELTDEARDALRKELGE